MNRECRGAILLKGRTKEQIARKVQGWACLECAAGGEYPENGVNARNAKTTFRHTWMPGMTGLEIARKESEARV